MPDKPTKQKSEFTITRVLDAPRDVIWRAWTDPDEATFWWHPRGVVSPREHMSIDARVGETYRYLMINEADGSEYPTAGTYIEVVEPERLVFTWGKPEDSVDEAPVITVILAERGDQTEMTFHLEGIDGRPGDQNVYDGWVGAFDMLDERLS